MLVQPSGTLVAGRPFKLVPLMGTPKGYSSFNIRTQGGPAHDSAYSSLWR